MSVPLEVHVAHDGDGWLNVDADEWLADVLGEPDEELSYDLGEWSDEHGSYVQSLNPALWAKERFAEVSGIDGDTEPTSFYSPNCENFLSDNIGVTLMQVREQDEQTTRTIAVVSHDLWARDSVYYLSPGQEWSDAIEWSRALAGCEKNHTYTVERTVYLYADCGQGTYRVTEQCREDDHFEHGGYVACPECTAPLSVMTF